MSSDKKMLFCRLRHKEAAPGFISTSYIGELVDDEDGFITLKDTGVLYENLVQMQNPATKELSYDINNQYYTHSSITNGVIRIRHDDCLFVREVESDDELLKGHQDALSQFKLARLNIQQANFEVGKKPERKPFFPRGN